MSLRAYVVTCSWWPDSRGNVVWAESRDKARFESVRSLRDARSCTVREALLALRVRRAPAYDLESDAREAAGQTIRSRNLVDLEFDDA